MNNLIILGQRIRSYRLAKGWSQEALALAAKINKNYLSDLERGNRNPTFLILSKICHALNISLADLFSDFKLP
ncbi:MAG: helix-turn-helix transcriptional regulator [Erysipelotrichaceae bacterium]|nr:helix-turn-helix transcriptional regulator [Erysipelotrichaceae bacterium]